MEIEIQLQADEKGYLDRECPNENCRFVFKILMDDWVDKVSEDKVHCPMCGIVKHSESWYTQEQIDEIQERAADYAVSYVQEQLDKGFREIENHNRNNKYVQFRYTPGTRVSFKNNPIGQREEWEQEIICEKCGTRYSVLGSAFFCPCCGHNSAKNCHEESLDTIKKMIDSLPEMENMLTALHGKDKAVTMYRNMLESSIGDIVSSFQKFAAVVYTEQSGVEARVNDFQIVEKGSNLFQKACGEGYDNWLSVKEMDTLNRFFQQRHLIEHNSAIVDQMYIDKTTDASYRVGQRLIIKDEDVLRFLSIVQKLGKGLLSIKSL